MTLQRSPRADPPTSQANLHIWEITAVQDLFWIGLAVLAIWFGYYLRSIFTPVLIGLILAYIFNPVISYARNRWGLPRLFTIIVLISLMMITTIGFMAWLGLKYLDVTTGQNAAGLDWMAIVGWPSIVYVVVQIIEGWILTPWVQSDSTDLSPVTVLIVVFIGGALGGLYGLILAIPIAACLKIFAVEILLPRLEQWASKS